MESTKNKFYWEERVKTLDFSNRKLILNMLWLISLDDHQKARLRYVLEKSIADNNEPKDEILGLTGLEELQRREDANTEFSE